MRQGGAEKTKSAGCDKRVLAYNPSQHKKNIFHGGKAQSGGYHINGRVNGFVKISRPESRARGRLVFRYFFNGGQSKPERESVLKNFFKGEFKNNGFNRQNNRHEKHSPDKSFKQGASRFGMRVFFEPEPKPD